MASIGAVRTVWSGVGGSPFYSTIRYLVGGSATGQEVVDEWETVLDSASPAFDNALVAVIDPEITIIESTTGTLTGTLAVTGATVSMDGSGDAIPPANQLLVQLSTPNIVAGRRLRGRLFLPGMLEANSDVNGAPTSGLRSDIDALFATMVTNLADSWCIYSPTHRVYATVNGASCWNKFAVLRSRRD
jgi:hypothetical protein